MCPPPAPRVIPCAQASFQELSVEVPGTGYVLIATSESSFIASARSAPFAVHGALAFTTPPPSQMFMGATFCTAVQVPLPLCVVGARSLATARLRA